MKKEHDNIFIAIAAHKDCAAVDVPFHHLICVGAKKNYPRFHREVLRDDSGENISGENDVYNELTAHYWMWKNVAGKYEYLGLCHYRRYFNFKPSGRHPRIGGGCLFGANPGRFGWRADLIRRTVADADICVARPENDVYVKNILPDNLSGGAAVKSIDEHFRLTNISWEKDLMEQCVRELYPEYMEAFEGYFSQKQKCMFNMLIMKREWFMTYSEWLFNLLWLYEEKLRRIPGADLSRSAGRWGEHLLNVFLLRLTSVRPDVRIKALQTVMFYNTDPHPSAKGRLKASLKDVFSVFFPYSTNRRDYIKWKYFMKG